MNQPELVTIFGGSGFVGTQIVQVLARAGHRIRVAVRRPDLAGHLRTLGGVGQIVLMQANVRDTNSVMAAARGASVIINLAAVGVQKGKQRFDAVNVAGARRVAEAARSAGAHTLVHMSVIGADAKSSSLFARSRKEGEDAVRAVFPSAIIMRPSIVFGPQDEFFNKLGMISRMLPVMPLFSGRTKFQPVYVGDVAEAFGKAAAGELKAGKTYELGGPDVLTNRELVERVLRNANRRNPILPLPSVVSPSSFSVPRLIVTPSRMMLSSPMTTSVWLPR